MCTLFLDLTYLFIQTAYHDLFLYIFSVNSGICTWDSSFYSELKYDTSSPMAFIGFDLLEKSETTPKLTSIFLSLPSHMRETSCKVDEWGGMRRK